MTINTILLSKAYTFAHFKIDFSPLEVLHQLLLSCQMKCTHNKEEYQLFNKNSLEIIVPHIQFRLLLI